MRLWSVVPLLAMLGCGRIDLTPLEAGSDACVPRTCSDLRATCGSVPNGCGGMLQCGMCAAGEMCGAAGANRCGMGECTMRTTCAAQGAQCGVISDNCGMTLQCGMCAAGMTCNASNRCEVISSPDVVTPPADATPPDVVTAPSDATLPDVVTPPADATPPADVSMLPVITAQPVNWVTTVGGWVFFSVVAEGAGLTYQWRKNGMAISGATSARTPLPGSTAVLADNGAQFSVVVRNGAGSVTSANATLTVLAMPSGPIITQQPASVTVTAGQRATFSVSARSLSGADSRMTVQWRRNGMNIGSGDRAPFTLTTPITARADTGTQYSAVITDTSGSVTSMAATLTVVESDGPVNREWSHWPAPADGPTGYVVAPRTVTDPATGLVWQREVAQNVAEASSGFSFAAARAYCDDLTLDGQTDWRMPTLIEAMSIVDSTRSTPPLLNPAFELPTMRGSFGRTTWVTTPIILPVNAREVVYDVGFSLWNSANSPSGIRCVRGGRVVANALPPARYTTAADTVRDEVTGLTWQRRTSPMLMTWSQGDTYCRTLNLGGLSSGWRLPRPKELNSLLDPNRFDTPPAINETAFPGTVGGAYWSASRQGDRPNFYYTVSFDNGSTQVIDPAFGARISVRCVR